jgi:hypothetical protein
MNFYLNERMFGVVKNYFFGINLTYETRRSIFHGYFFYYYLRLPFTTKLPLIGSPFEVGCAISTTDVVGMTVYCDASKQGLGCLLMQ